MTETTTSSQTTHTALKSAVIFVRILQAAAGGFAFILVAGALLGNMHVLAFVMIAVFVLLLMVTILVLELVAVNGLKRWAA